MIRMNYLIAILIATSASLSFAADTTPSDSAPSWAKEAQQEIKNKKYRNEIFNFDHCFTPKLFGESPIMSLISAICTSPTNG